MNPDAAEILAVFRKHLPKAQLMLTSNSIPLLKPPGVHARIDELFAAGLNILALDDYAASHKATAIVRTYRGCEILDYKRGHNVKSPYKRIPVSKHKIFIMEDFEKAAMAEEAVGSKKVSNHAGVGMKPLAEPLVARCARPFREMTFYHTGTVVLCCNDWRGKYVCGDVMKDDIDDIWNGEEYTAARIHLYHRDRTFKPCDVCNNVSYRVGLLPDKMGKADMVEPNEESRRVVDVLGNAKPYTTPVLREWEK